MKVKVCEPFLNGNELKYVKKAVKDNWISSLAPQVKEFEKKFAKWLYQEDDNWINKPTNGYATTTTNGTTALMLCLHTLKIGGNFGGSFKDEVIIPDFTMIAVPNAVHWSGAKVVLADVEYDSFNMNVEQIRPLITKNTKAVIVTHTYGIPNRMDEIMELAKEYDFKVIEDCAEGLGATYNGQKVGTFGDISMFSFYANKIITTGEGGMVCSKERKLIERAYFLKNHTFSKEKHFWHKEIGHNMRMTGLQAAIGLAQLEKIDEYIEKRRKNGKEYYTQLSKKGKRLNFWNMPKGDDYFAWMWGVRLYDNKDKVRKLLSEKGIETRSYFIPVHRQKPYLRDDNSYPISNQLYEEGFYLPSGSGLTKKQIKYVCDNLIKAIEEVEK